MTKFLIDRASARGFPHPCSQAIEGEIGLAWDNTMNMGWFVNIETLADLEAIAKEVKNDLLIDFGSESMPPSITIVDDYLE